MWLLVLTIDLGDRGTCVELLDPPHKVLWKLLLGWRGHCSDGVTQLGCDPVPCAMVAPYLGGELQEGELGGGVGQYHFTPHLRSVLHHDALCLPISSQQHAAHGLGRGEGTSLSSSPQSAARHPTALTKPRNPIPAP